MKTSRAHMLGSMTNSELSESNPVIPAGHVVMASDGNLSFKIGNGMTPYNDLPRHVTTTDDNVLLP